MRYRIIDRTRKRTLVGVLMTITLTLAAVGGAAAQHGGTDHLTGTGEFGTIDFVSKLTVNPVEPGAISDVAALGNFAYLGRWNTAACAGPEGGTLDGGVYVVDISNPARPRQVGFIPAHQDTIVSEGVQALHIDTPKFNGDILVLNNEGCGKNYKAGISIWNITNPLKPFKLSENLGDFTRGVQDVMNTPHDANQVHSAFAWDAGNKAYVVIVDDEEAKDVDILDITNPRKPVLISELDLNQFNIAQPEIGLGTLTSFLHDMVVKQIDGHFLMLLSYWDGGYVILNVDDPAHPIFVGDTDFTNPDPELLFQTGRSLTPEGNGHYAEWTADNARFVTTDEDFDAFRTTPLTRATGPGAPKTYTTVPVGGAPVTLLADKRLNGPVAYGGYGCPGTSTPIPLADSIFPPGSLEPGEEQIIVLQRGPVGDPDNTEPACFPGEKADNATDQGWDAVLFVARHLGSAALDDPPFCGFGAFPDDEQIVATCTTHAALHELFNRALNFDLPYPDDDPNDVEPDIGEVGFEIDITSIFDGWGYIHLYDASTFAELDTFAIPQAMDPAFAIGFGVLSVHEIAAHPTDSSRFYSSYYAGGFRAFKIKEHGCGSDGAPCIVQVGGYLDPLGNDFWGVEMWRHPATGQLYILASDRDSGLWIFQDTNP
ncbi:MAG TPA: hypothetical protein VJ793_15795 [Anaerolineae bacterium]|nr:hypothetical protein [Anaerolineae bacterium]